MESTSLLIKIASEDEEISQIHQLNYETFVEEIPQHSQNTKRRLVDTFDHENTYIIAKNREEVVGMIAIRANRPFSLDAKLENIDQYLPAGAKACEVRLLSVKPQYRKTRVFYQLCERLIEYCLEQNYNIALISGTLRQIKLYKKIGFVAFGPVVGTKDAPYQPMYLTKERFETSAKVFRQIMKKRRFTYSFLPGPVVMNEAVKEAMGREAISHRNEQFMDLMKDVKRKLCKLTAANYAALAVGTGTLGNDLVGAQLKKLGGRGLILANGEFGYRLINHAKRLGLSFLSIEKDWNTPITLEEIENTLHKNNDVKWLWTVHCETSTGYLYDISEIQLICRKYNVEVCLDACSTIGALPVNLQHIYLASAVSGKGIGAFPGLAIVFHRDPVQPDERLPRYMDLGLYQNADSVPFTHSSNLLFALHAALQEDRSQFTYKIGKELREKLMESSVTLLGDENYAPHCITFVSPPGTSSRSFGNWMKNLGILLSYESNYLLTQNWLQVVVMGNHSRKDALSALEIVLSEYKKFICLKDEIG